MSIGQMVRRALGPNFKQVGAAYRAIFVDIEKIAAFIDRHLPPGAHGLDVGGGDGAIVDAVLRRRPDVRFTMTDIAESIGSFIDPGVRDRVELCPATSADAMRAAGRRFDAVTITDVLHHVPAPQRRAFWDDIRGVAEATGASRIIIKDLMPQTWRSALGYLSDRFVTGDAHVAFMRPEAMIADIRSAFGETVMSATVDEPDPANYCIVIDLRRSPQA